MNSSDKSASLKTNRSEKPEFNFWIEQFLTKLLLKPFSLKNRKVNVRKKMLCKKIKLRYKTYLKEE